MAQHEPQTWGWLAAALLGLINILYIAVRKLTNGRTDDVSATLRHDLDHWTDRIDRIENQVDKLRDEVSNLAGEIKATKVMIGDR